MRVVDSLVRRKMMLFAPWAGLCYFHSGSYLLKLDDGGVGLVLLGIAVCHDAAPLPGRLV